MADIPCPDRVNFSQSGFVEAALAAEGVDPTGKIESIDVPSKSLPTLLGELNRPLRIDVLQIDAEGYDDAVIYASKLEMTSPAIIYFETDHIELSRLQDLKRYLERLGYTLFTSRFNCLCISRHAPLSIIM